MSTEDAESQAGYDENELQPGAPTPLSKLEVCQLVLHAKLQS